MNSASPLDPQVVRALRSAMSRRGFLQSLGAGGAAAFLAACGISGSSGTPHNRDNPVATPVDLSDTNKTLTWANWTLYLDYDEEKKVYPTLRQFEKESGINVKYREDIDDNNTFWGKVQGQLANGSDIGYDLVTPTDWMAGRWIRMGYAARLDAANIPNKKNILPNLENVGFDPGRNFSLTWQSGFAGIAWNKEKYPKGLKTLDDLWAPDLKGKVDVLAEMRDTVGLIMLSQGVAIDGPFTDDQFQAALDVLSEQLDSGQIKGVKGNEYKEDLVSGQAYAAIAWSGDIFQLNAETPGKYEFIIPESGGTLWSDNLLIPATSQHKENAEKLMNFYYQPDIAAETAAWVNYICPVQGAQKYMEKIDPELAASPWIFPSDKTLNETQVFRPLTPAEEIQFTAAFGDVIGG